MYAWRSLAVALLVAVSACFAASPASASVGSLSEFVLPASQSVPEGITMGPDGALWFTEYGANSIGRITPGGKITTYPLPTFDANPQSITVGPDGALWFTEWYANKIGRITTSGSIREFSLPTCGSCPGGKRLGPYGIAKGPDGALWFTANFGSAIGRITTSGAVTVYPLPNRACCTHAYPLGITRGPDGALWFTSQDGIGRITTSGRMRIFGGSAYANSITTGPDGALWFTSSYDDHVDRITTAGKFTLHPVDNGCYPQGIAAISRHLWFACGGLDQLVPMTTTGGFTRLRLPLRSPYGDFPFGVTRGPDKAVWFTEQDVNRIGSITTN